MDSQGETCCEKPAVNSWLLLELSDKRRPICARPSVSPAERKFPKFHFKLPGVRSIMQKTRPLATHDAPPDLV